MATGGIQQTEGDSMVSQTLTPGAEEREEDPGETLKDLEGAGKDSDTDNEDTDSTKDTIPGHDGTSDESETDSGNTDSKRRETTRKGTGAMGEKEDTPFSAGASEDAKDNICTVPPSRRDSSDGGMVHPEPQKVCELCDDPGVLASGHCSDCAQDLCSGCIHRHQRMSIVGSHTIIILPQEHLQHQLYESGEAGHHSLSSPQPRRLYSPSVSETDVPDHCHKHKREELRFFCRNCQLPVCRDCILTAHKQHLTDDISDASASALHDLSAMTAQLQQKKELLESHQRALQVYRGSFEDKAQKVTEMVQYYYNEITAAVEASFQQLSTDLQQCRKTEAGRMDAQEQIVNKSLDGINRLLNQQTPIFHSPHAVLRQRDIVADALTTIDLNVDKIQVNRSEFLVSKNPRLTRIPDDILGRVAFTPIRALPDQLSAPVQPEANIKEITLRRELAFSNWEMNCAKSSVKTIVEGSLGTVWVATPRSIIKIENRSVTKDSIHIPDDIASISAGPDGKLLVLFGQGGAVKLYSNGSWSRGFTVVGRGITSMASRELRGRSQIYVAETPHEDFPSRIMVYTAEGKMSYQQQLPLGVLHTHISQDTDSPRLDSPGLSSTSPPRLKISTMAVGKDGSLCFGDTAGGRVIMMDGEGNLTGEYRGPDGRGGCVPRSVCFADNGQVVVADSAQSSVELVSAEGRLLATLLVREHFQDSGIPTAVAIDSRKRLWVGTSMGHVSAYSFLHRQQ